MIRTRSDMIQARARVNKRCPFWKHLSSSEIKPRGCINPKQAQRGQYPRDHEIPNESLEKMVMKSLYSDISSCFVSIK